MIQGAHLFRVAIADLLFMKEDKGEREGGERESGIGVLCACFYFFLRGCVSVKCTKNASGILLLVYKVITKLCITVYWKITSNLCGL